MLFFFQTILRFTLSRKIIKIYNDIAQKHGNVTVEYFQKYEKLKNKQNKLKLDIDFLNNANNLLCIQNSLSFKLPNISNNDALSIRKRLLRSAINKRIKNFNISQKNSVNPKSSYPNSYQLLTSASLIDLEHLTTINCFRYH